MTKGGLWWRWFAWRPVRCEDGSWAFWERVERARLMYKDFYGWHECVCYRRAVGKDGGR